MQNSKKIIMMAAGLLFLGVSVSYAEITLKGDYKGTVIITDPQAKATVLDEGMEVPKIADTSNIEVFDGSMIVELEEGETVTLFCGGNKGNVSGPGSFAVKCTDKEAYYEAVKGTLSLVTNKNEGFDLKEGERKNVDILPTVNDAAEETQANQETGTQINQNDLTPPVDSRSLESSPT